MGKFWRSFAMIVVLACLVLNVVCYILFVANHDDPPPKAPEAPEPEKTLTEVTSMVLECDDDNQALVIRTAFSAPMISPYFVGTVLPPDKAPVSFKPSLKGRFEWEKPRELVFTLADVPENTHINAKVQNTLTDAAGQAVSGKLSYRLGGPRIVFSDARQQGMSANGNPILSLTFNSPVQPALLEHFLRLYGDDDAIGYTTLGKSPKKEVNIVTDKAVCGRLKLELKKGFRGVALLPSLFEQRHFVTAESRLLLSDVNTREAGGGNFKIQLRFNARMSNDALEKYVDISPPVAFYVTHVNGQPGLIAPFKPGKAYTLLVRKGLTSLEGMTLEENVVKHLRFSDLSPNLRLVGEGFYLPADADMSIPVHTLNVEAFDMQLEKLYPNNVVPLVRYGSMHYFPSHVARSLPEKTLSVKGAWNEWVETKVDLKDLLAEASDASARTTDTPAEPSDASVVKRPKGTFCVRAYLGEPHWRSFYTLLQVTDLGITTKRSDQDYLVWVTSIATAEPLAGVKVALKSRTNQTVREGVTDPQGLAVFQGPFPRGDDERPFVVIAEKGDDLAFLDLFRTHVNAAQRLPGGRRYLEEGYEAFVWSERGVYRPNDDVNLYAMVRDRVMQSPPPFPVRFRIIKPDGRVWRILKGALSEFGTATAKLQVPGFLPTGNYRAEVLDAEDDVLGAHSFLVEEIRPDRMQVDIAVTPSRLVAGQKATIQATAYELFGKEAAGKKVQGVLKIRSCSFAPGNSKQYRFACTHERESLGERTLLLGNKVLDDKGQVTFEVDLPDHPLPPGRFMARIAITVTEAGGRSVTAHASRIVDPYPVYLGIARDTPSPCVMREVNFSIKALTPQAAPADTQQAVVHVYKREWVHGYQRMRNGEWRWMSREERTKVGCHPIVLKRGKGFFGFKPDQVGHYSVTVEAPGTGHLTSIGFHVAGSGWSARSFMNPAEVDLTQDKPAYLPGDTARIEIASPFDGALLLTVEGQKVYHSQVAQVSCGINTITLPVRDEYWPNVYVTAQVVRPYWPLKPGVDAPEEKPDAPAVPADDPPVNLTEPAKGDAADAPVDDAKPEPAVKPEEGQPKPAVGPDEETPAPAVESAVEPAVQPAVVIRKHRLADRDGSAAREKRPYRGFGVMTLKLDRRPRTVAIDLTAPEKVKPGQPITVSLATSDQADKPVKSEVVIALVDEGLLSLTAEAVPDPMAFFAALRALECRTSDVFSFLVPARGLVPGGGGPAAGLARRRLNPIQYKAERPMVFFYKPVLTDDQGKAAVTLEAPEFAGQLRVVALAATRDRVGSASNRVFVRPDVVVRATFPRCLAQKDRAEIPLVLFNNVDQEKKVAINVAVDGPMEPVAPVEVTVPAGQEAVVRLPVTAQDALGALSLTLLIDHGDRVIKKEHQLPVRPPWGSMTLAGSGVVKADTENADLMTITADAGEKPAFFKGTEEAMLVMSPSPMTEFIPAARFLVRYPYGCAEQTSSGLLGLAAASKLQVEGLTRQTASYIASGIQRLAAMQTESGGLSMWPGYRSPVPWVSVFAAHVLNFIHKGNEMLLADVRQELLDYVERLITDDEHPLDTRAYAGYVCAVSGREVAPQLLRLSEHDVSRRAGRFLACALKRLNRKREAELLLARPFTGEPESLHFLSPVVEEAMTLMTHARLGNKDKLNGAVANLRKMAGKRGRWGTTHECAWALLALHAWSESMGFDQEKTPDVALAAGEETLFSGPLKKTETFKLEAGNLASLALTVRSASAFFSWTLSGVPKEKPPIKSHPDFKLKKTFYDFEGSKVEDGFILGKPYIVELSFDTIKPLQDVVVEDLLPGGFDIENLRLSSRISGDLFTDRTLPVDHLDIRDDRCLLFLDVPRSRQVKRNGKRVREPGVYRYLVRAVSAGEFILPPTLAECMYDPAQQSMTPGGKITVKRSEH